MAERRQAMQDSKQPAEPLEDLRPSWRIDGALAMEVDYPCGHLLAAPSELEYLIVEVILDSGAGMHVIHPSMVANYNVKESVLSRIGAGFLAASGDRLKNYGEVLLSILTSDSAGKDHEITSKFEVTDVTRPLWSVGLICDSGLDVKFTRTHATVSTKGGQELCFFQRVNGLYIAKVKIKAPKKADDFRRQGS